VPEATYTLSVGGLGGGAERRPADRSLIEMDPAYQAIPPLQAIFDGASRFGLTDAEVWRAFDECLDGTGPDATMAEYVQELTAELARRILRNERCTPSEDRRVASRERR
jgi:hypothetical protein